LSLSDRHGRLDIATSMPIADGQDASDIAICVEPTALELLGQVKTVVTVCVHLLFAFHW